MDRRRPNVRPQQHGKKWCSQLVGAIGLRERTIVLRDTRDAGYARDQDRLFELAQVRVALKVEVGCGLAARLTRRAAYCLASGQCEKPRRRPRRYLVRHRRRGRPVPRSFGS